MRQRRLLLTGCILIALLGWPREGTAGIVEVILEMSGPQMIGGLSGCVLKVDRTFQNCSILGVPVQKGDRGLKFGWPLPSEAPQVWFFLQGGTYFSTGKDQDNGTGTADDSDFKFGRIGMVTADPMFAFRSKAGYHAIGVSYNFIFSGNFEPVHNFGLKLRPVVVRWLGLEWEYNLRLYWDGFDAVESSEPAVLVRGHDFEAVHAISASLPIFR